MSGMIQSPAKTYTVEEFWDYVHLPENAGRRLELVNGKVVEKEASKLTVVISKRISNLLNTYLIHQNMGKVTGITTYYALSTQDLLSPDIAYVSKQRQPKLNSDYFPSAPNLAIEIINPETKAYYLQEKLHAYANNGVESIWEVYPEINRLNVMYYPAKSGKSFGEMDTLDCGDILPNFRLNVREIFPQ